MGGNITKYSWVIFILLLLTHTNVIPTAYAEAEPAPSATLYLSPSSASLKQNEVLTISIREDSGDEKVNVVQIGLTYPTDLLEFAGFDDSESGFSISFKASDGEGKLEVTRGATPAVSGDQLITKVNFKGKANSGSAVLTFTDNSKVVQANPPKELKKNASGGTYILAPAAPTLVPATNKPPSAAKPVPKAPAPSNEPASRQLSVAVTTPNTQKRNEQNQVGFWIPLLILAGTLLVSTMAASGFTTRGIYRHFKFLRPVNRIKRYPHL